MNCQQKDNVSMSAVILAANTDFGRCNLASRIPPALWPILDEPAINRMFKKLSDMSVKRAIICCNGNKPIFQQAIKNTDSMELNFLDEQMPFGTAGCIREALQLNCDDILLVVPSQIVNLPDLTDAIKRHLNNQSALTILSGTNPNSKSTAQIYIANRDIAECIPAKGYFDIKENLIPVLVRKGRKIIAETLPVHLHTFRNHSQYLEALSNYLIEDKHYSTDVFIAGDANVNAGAKIFGPVIIMNNSSISENAVIVGPAVIGKNVSIDKNSVIEQSVLWDGSNVGMDCFITHCVVDYDAAIPSYSNAENKAVLRTDNIIKTSIISAIEKIQLPSEAVLGTTLPLGKIAAVVILAAAFIWSYFPEIKELLGVWNRNDDYSAGLLVPFLAAAAIWTRKEKFTHISGMSFLYGILLFLIAQMIRLFGLYFMYASAERLSMVVSIWSVIIMLFGWRLFYKNLSPFLFLLLMLPPPHIIHNSIMLPLQKIATSGAEFCLEMLGYAVNREGNILFINNTAVAVSEACSGLRMITAFLIIVVFISLIIRKNRWEKFSLLLSSLPIAFACNIARLTLTAIAFTVVWGQRWAEMIHEFSGYAMVPLAIAIVMLELRVMNVLITKSET